MGTTLKFRKNYYEVFSFEKLDAVAEYYLLGNDNDWNNKEDDRKEILSKFSENNSPIFETPIGAEFILAVNDDEDYFERENGKFDKVKYLNDNLENIKECKIVAFVEKTHNLIDFHLDDCNKADSVKINELDANEHIISASYENSNREKLEFKLEDTPKKEEFFYTNIELFVRQDDELKSGDVSMAEHFLNILKNEKEIKPKLLKQLWTSETIDHSDFDNKKYTKFIFNQKNIQSLNIPNEGIRDGWYKTEELEILSKNENIISDQLKELFHRGYTLNNDEHDKETRDAGSRIQCNLLGNPVFLEIGIKKGFEYAWICSSDKNNKITDEAGKVTIEKLLGHPDFPSIRVGILFENIDMYEWFLEKAPKKRFLLPIAKNINSPQEILEKIVDKFLLNNEYGKVVSSALLNHNFSKNESEILSYLDKMKGWDVQNQSKLSILDKIKILLNEPNYESIDLGIELIRLFKERTIIDELLDGAKIEFNIEGGKDHLGSGGGQRPLLNHWMQKKVIDNGKKLSNPTGYYIFLSLLVNVNIDNNLDDTLKVENIKKLSLKKCDLEKLPVNFSNLSSIEMLDISFNDKLSIEHNTISSLKKLKLLIHHNTSVDHFSNDEIIINYPEDSLTKCNGCGNDECTISEMINRYDGLFCQSCDDQYNDLWFNCFICDEIVNPVLNDFKLDLESNVAEFDSLFDEEYDCKIKNRTKAIYSDNRIIFEAVCPYCEQDSEISDDELRGFIKLAKSGEIEYPDIKNVLDNYQNENNGLTERQKQLISDNDIKIDNQHYWWESMDDFISYYDIVVLDISRKDLDNNNREGLKELGSVDINDWDGLAELLNEEEANLHKEDFAMEELTYLVFLYSEGRYVTSIQANEE